MTGPTAFASVFTVFSVNAVAEESEPAFKALSSMHAKFLDSAAPPKVWKDSQELWKRFAAEVETARSTT